MFKIYQEFPALVPHPDPVRDPGEASTCADTSSRLAGAEGLCAAVKGTLPETRISISFSTILGSPHMTSSFAGLDDLYLLQHGDVRERDLWPTVSGALSNYERFWRTLIVLLSNRIKPGVPIGDPAWIQVRPMIPRPYEQLAMHSYSLFYFTARARQAIDEDGQRIASRNYPHPEIAFFLLEAAFENAIEVKRIAQDEILLHLELRWKLPKHPEDLYRTIRAYRNAFTHNPVLGRATRQGRELLPPETRLPKRGHRNVLWSDIWSIPASEMVDGLDLKEGLWRHLSDFLQRLWQSLTEAFLQAHHCGQFIEDLGLAGLLPIRRVTPTTLTMGASGTSETSIPGLYYSLSARSDARS